MKSVMKKDFSNVPSVNIPRSGFDRSHGNKTTFDGGYLVPVLVDEALPGDTFNVNTAGFARMATPIYPVMDNLYMDTFFFAVPYRLVFDNWEKMNGAQDNPGDSTDFTIPTMTSPAGGYPNESLSDYMGIPTQIAGLEHSALWHRAYNLIWNEWFRDENLQDSVVVDKGDTASNPADYTLLKRGKRHDYFTSCLPWPQKGEEALLPLGTSAPITGLGFDNTSLVATAATLAYTDGVTEAITHGLTANRTTQPFIVAKQDSTTGDPSLYADLTNATASTINQLREAFQVQKMLEKDARGGTRYTEVVRTHFGVVSPDARLQRPEYLGGGSTPINFTPVAQTSSTDATSPQGHLSSTAAAVFNRHGFSKSFTEHTLIIGLVNVRADLTYQTGLNRMFSRSTKIDFYWPSLAHLGEQAVLNKEIYAQATAADDEVFGYQERFAEYRYKPSQISGKFRSNDAVSLDAWHLSQDFTTLPVLDDSFIQDNPPIDRVIAVPSEPHFIYDSFVQMRCVRPMPLYSQPGMIDHF